MAFFKQIGAATSEVSFKQAIAEDASELAELRVLAMKPSLDAVGRFDHERARNRFLLTYVPADTWHILWDEVKVGVIVLRNDSEDLVLDHFYIHPDFQSRGIGSSVLQSVLAFAQTEGRSVRVTALKGSESNNFYLANGFVLASTEEWDHHYKWGAMGKIS